MVEMMK